MLMTRKMLMVCSALTVLGILPGCDKLDDLFGVERTMPDGVNYAGGPRHAPLLNPDLNANYDVNTVQPPKENYPAAPTLNPETGQYGSQTGSMGKSGRHVPVENGQAQDMQPDASATAQQQPAAADASALPMPADQNAPVATVTTGNAYPPLSTVPPVPVHTGKEQSADEMKALDSQHDASEAARAGLMGNQNATVMTSPQTGQMVDNAATAMPQPTAAPLPPPAVTAPPPPPPSTPQPQAGKASQTSAQNDTGFNSWLHNMFSPDHTKDNSPAVEAPVQAAAPAQNPVQDTAAAPRDLMTAAPSQNAAGPGMLSQPVPQEALASPPPAPEPMPMAANPAPAIEPLPSPPAPAVPPPQMTPPPPPPAQTASEQVPPSPPVAGQADMEPVHLHPPGSMAADSSSLGDNSAAAPVVLVSPQAASSNPAGDGQHFLADSRYAARRMSQIDYDAPPN